MFERLAKVHPGGVDFFNHNQHLPSPSRALPPFPSQPDGLNQVCVGRLLYLINGTSYSHPAKRYSLSPRPINVSGKGKGGGASSRGLWGLRNVRVFVTSAKRSHVEVIIVRFSLPPLPAAAKLPQPYCILHHGRHLDWGQGLMGTAVLTAWWLFKTHPHPNLCYSDHNRYSILHNWTLASRLGKCIVHHYISLD